MQQKVQFIATVLHNPKLIILDEPFSGFDPINVNIIKDEILNFAKEGKTVIAISHDDRYFHHADRVLKMEFGKFIDA